MTDWQWEKAESRRTAHLRKKAEREERALKNQELAEAWNPNFEPLPRGLGLHASELEENIIVPSSCTGILIGKKGENLKEIEQRLKVVIKLSKLKDGNTLATVTGKSSGDVVAATRELDFVFATVDLPPGTVGWAVGKGGRHLTYIKELSGVASLRIVFENEEAAPAEATLAEEEEDVEAKSRSRRSGPCWLEMKGRRECVSNARMCIEAHLSYYPVYQEMEEVERQLDDELSHKAAQVGYRPSKSRGGSYVADSGGGAGQRPRSQSRARSQVRNNDARGAGGTSSSQPPRALPKSALKAEPSGGDIDGSAGRGGKGQGRSDGGRGKGRDAAVVGKPQLPERGEPSPTTRVGGSSRAGKAGTTTPAVATARKWGDQPTPAVPAASSVAKVTIEPNPTAAVADAALVHGNAASSENGGGKGARKGPSASRPGAKADEKPVAQNPEQVKGEPAGGQRQAQQRTRGAKKDSRRWVPKDEAAEQ